MASTEVVQAAAEALEAAWRNGRTDLAEAVLAAVEPMIRDDEYATVTAGERKLAAEREAEIRADERERVMEIVRDTLTPEIRVDQDRKTREQTTEAIVRRIIRGIDRAESDGASTAFTSGMWSAVGIVREGR